MKSSVLLAMLLLFATGAAAETVTGKACHQFPDGQPLPDARAAAIALAEQNALVGYPVFAASIASVQDPALRSEFISSLAGALLRDVRVTHELMNLGNREVCRAIAARIDPRETIERVVAKMNAPHSAKLAAYGWYPENDLARVLEAVSFTKGDQQRIVFVFECKRKQDRYLDTRHAVQQERVHIRLTWIDRHGIPGTPALGRGECTAPNAVGSIELPLPPWDSKYWIDLSETTRDFASWQVR